QRASEAGKKGGKSSNRNS
ncbi:stress-induced protein, partial [Salmonella enterica]|nr:stress-induced protein [Salmonella enterica]EDW1770009.1 stress-induced protein [Salmonella enterica subsp. enterica serovar Kentucky]EIL5370216.1 stress-induced protein [Salmonella enterica subsp. enterica serovar Infantis]EBM5735899.1 stress-induced protein [Salmonella enterica]EHJ0851356.1 stress-induced protein [Salmonella enterica]